MPTFHDIVVETYYSNVREIAELCELRDAMEHHYRECFSKCRSLDGMLALELQRRDELHRIDSRIGQLTKGSRKLLDQMEATA